MLLSCCSCGKMARARPLFRSLRRASFSLVPPCPPSLAAAVRPTSQAQGGIFAATRHAIPPNPLLDPSWVFRSMSHGTVSLVISNGKPKFEAHEVPPPKKEKWMTKKRLKMKRKKEKQKRKEANKRDPRRLTVKGKKKQKFANAEERIKSKLEKAKIKEALLIERLKRYEVPKVHGPEVRPHDLTGEERFFMKKMAQKKSNYVPIGRRGVFGGVILNMHMHWKRHETVKVICKPCKPGQVHEYADEIARLSGGIPIQILGDDTIVFYRGRNYMQPEVMSPVDTLSKKRALEKSKYEQSLESVRRFIAIAEKELELYYRHLALYGDPTKRNPLSILDKPKGESWKPKRQSSEMSFNGSSPGLLDTEADSNNEELSEIEDHFVDEHLCLSTSESDSENDNASDLGDGDPEDGSSCMTEMIFSGDVDSLSFERKLVTENQGLSEQNLINPQ